MVAPVEELKRKCQQNQPERTGGAINEIKDRRKGSIWKTQATWRHVLDGGTFTSSQLETNGRIQSPEGTGTSQTPGPD